MKVKTKEKIIGTISLTMIIIGTLAFIGVADAYSTGYLTMLEFILQMTISGAVAIAGGVILKWILHIMFYHHKHGYPRTISRKMRKRVKKYEKYRRVA